MTAQTKKKIAELESQLTPRGVYEALRWGAGTSEGRRFWEIYSKVREIEGTQDTVVAAAPIDNS